MKKLSSQYNDAFFTIHTNSTQLDDFFLQLIKNYEIIYEDNMELLQVFSNFIHSDIFILGDSCLSFVPAYVNERQMNIFPDRLSTSINRKTFAPCISYQYFDNNKRISEFLEKDYIVQRIFLNLKELKRMFYHRTIKILRFLKLR